MSARQSPWPLSPAGLKGSPPLPCAGEPYLLPQPEVSKPRLQREHELPAGLPEAPDFSWVLLRGLTPQDHAFQLLLPRKESTGLATLEPPHRPKLLSHNVRPMGQWRLMGQQQRQCPRNVDPRALPQTSLSEAAWLQVRQAVHVQSGQGALVRQLPRPQVGPSPSPREGLPMPAGFIFAPKSFQSVSTSSPRPPPRLAHPGGSCSTQRGWLAGPRSRRWQVIGSMLRSGPRTHPTGPEIPTFPSPPSAHLGQVGNKLGVAKGLVVAHVGVDSRGIDQERLEGGGHQTPGATASPPREVPS